MKWNKQIDRLNRWKIEKKEMKREMEKSDNKEKKFNNKSNNHTKWTKSIYAYT